MTTTTTVRTADLHAAYAGSFFTILGAGGDLDEWVTGINGMLAEAGIGTPVAWYSTSGAAINLFAAKTHGDLPSDRDSFADDLSVLMFPLDGLDIGKLAIFKVQSDARWFDDVIQNMGA